jgi:D-amino peptidase
MTSDVKAVVEGILTKDPLAEILICDAHSHGNNLNILDLPNQVKLIQGRTRPYYMVEGLDSTFHAGFLIGYHAPVGTYKGLMDHSYSSSSFYEVKINGQVVGESEINAILLSEENVPIVLISGDDQLSDFSQPNFPDTTFVVTKRSIGKFSAELIHPKKVFETLKQETITVLNRLKKVSCFRPTQPYLVEILLVNTLQANFAGILPGVERIGGRKLRFHASDGKELYRYIMSILYLCAASKK